MLTPSELQQIQRLHLQLKRRVDSPFAGEYRSAFRGQGMEFEEVRPYVPGDDVRHIDWNVTARTGEPFVKVFREERELTLMLVLDRSGSLRTGTGGPDERTDKGLQAARLAGALAWAAVRNGDRVGMLSFTDRVEDFLPPRKTRGHAGSVLRAAFDEPPARRGTNIAGALEHLGRVLNRRAVICVLSDFLCPVPFQQPLSVLSHRHQVNCFLVHDPLEAAMPAVGLIEVEDAETGRTRLLDSRTVRAKTPVSQRLQRLRASGAWASPVSTIEDPFHQLLAHFRKLERTR
ncbi:MAG: DUF58 domain-containing protein [Myxococcota bacterium]|nr:DUF58 domain-containing protein [Myxococcota bacterium]